MIITIVCGPPCAGKNWYVEQNRQPGDIVIDYDLIAREIGSQREHLHRIQYRQSAWSLYSYRVAQAVDSTANVWIVRARPAKFLADDTVLAPVIDRADIVELHPPTDVLLKRAGARRHPGWQERALRAWFREWGGDR